MPRLSKTTITFEPHVKLYGPEVAFYGSGLYEASRVHATEHGVTSELYAFENNELPPPAASTNACHGGIASD